MAKESSNPMRKELIDLVKDTEEVIKNHPYMKDWQKAYLRYGNGIKDKIDVYKERGSLIDKINNLPDDVRIYSCISLVTKSSKRTAYYDMRFRGQHICNVSVNSKEGVKLHFKENDLNNNKKEKYLKIKTFDENDWKGKKGKSVVISIDSDKANQFFDELRNLPHGTSKNKEIKSREHKLESLVLENINESDGSIKIPNLQFIQPIKFGSGFFQMPTPFAASKHRPTPSISKKNNAITGGGIDILARVSTPQTKNNWSFAVVELKDENNNKEPVSKVARQALIYATFLAYLIAEEDDDLGKIWYNILREQSDQKEVPDTIDILVMTMMPSSKKENEDEQLDEVYKFTIGNKKINLSLCTCYLDVDDKFTKIKNATGTFIEHKKQPKKK